MIYFITGASSGLGKALAEACLTAGHGVAATFRKQGQADSFTSSHPEALGMVCDVSDEPAVKAAVSAAQNRFGRLDVAVNNAGYGLLSAVEEVSDAEARAQFDTNVFGALNVTRAVLPQMRAQGAGRILQISSVGGLVAFPAAGIYNASKFALEGFSEALYLEAKPLGIHVTIVEPGPFRTEWAGASLKTAARQIDAYAETAHKRLSATQGYSGNQPGSPQLAAQAMLQLCELDNPPLRLPLGEMAYQTITAKLDRLSKELEAFAWLGKPTDFSA